MTEIPKVPFVKKNNPELEFEIITLKSLFSRNPKLNHFLGQPHRVEFYHILFITKGTVCIDFSKVNSHTEIFGTFFKLMAENVRETMRPKYGQYYGFESAIEGHSSMATMEMFLY